MLHLFLLEGTQISHPHTILLPQLSKDLFIHLHGNLVNKAAVHDHLQEIYLLLRRELGALQLEEIPKLVKRLVFVVFDRLCELRADLFDCREASLSQVS